MSIFGCAMVAQLGLSISETAPEKAISAFGCRVAEHSFSHFVVLGAVKLEAAQSAYADLCPLLKVPTNVSKNQKWTAKK